MSANEVEDLKGRVAARIEKEQQRRLASGLAMLSNEDVRRLAASSANAEVSELRRRQISTGLATPAQGADVVLANQVLDGLFRLGPLQSLQDNQDIWELNFNRTECWAVHMDGKKQLVQPPPFPSQEALTSWVRAQGMYSGASSRPWDSANPVIELELEGGHRLVGIREAGASVYVSIRLLRIPNVTLDELRLKNDFDERVQAFLVALVKARMNVIISGATGSAKTTLMRAMSREVPASERIVVIEHFPELGIDRDKKAHPDVVTLQERVSNSEGVGAIPMSQLVRTSRRLDPDRVFVGECVGEEIVDMLEALSQGNDGGMTTIHAKSARAVPSRIATYAYRKGMSIEAALHLTAQAVDFIIHMERVREANGVEGRKIVSIVEVVGYDATAGHVVTSEVFSYTPGEDSAYPAADVTPERSARLRAGGWRPERDHVEGPILVESGMVL